MVADRPVCASRLASLFGWVRGSPRISAGGIRAGDDLVISADYWPASEDIPGFLRTAQQQFPGVRLHLLVGFGRVEVSRNEDSSEREGAANECRQQPRSGSADCAAPLIAPVRESGEQGPVVVLRYASGGRVIATTIPPQPKGEAVPYGH